MVYNVWNSGPWVVHNTQRGSYALMHLAPFQREMAPFLHLRNSPQPTDQPSHITNVFLRKKNYERGPKSEVYVDV